MIILKKILAVFLKDLKSEFRTRYSATAVLLFVLTTVTMIIFSLAAEKITPGVSAGILWIVLFFGSMTGLSKTFISEEERGTALLLKLNAESYAVYFGKLIFNIILSLSINIMAVLLFLLLVRGFGVSDLGGFSLVILLGSIGLAAATTIISSLIAKAGSKNALFPVLSFPILLPLILLGIDATKYTITGIPSGNLSDDYRLMFAYSGILITVSYFLFDIVWRD
ncbi:MAG: heme exporter protein CcmB [Candidatus Kapaibacterium sp.]